MLECRVASCGLCGVGDRPFPAWWESQYFSCPSPWAVVTIPRGVAAVAAACAMAVVDGRLCL